MSVPSDIQQALEVLATSVLTPVFGADKLSYSNVPFTPDPSLPWATVRVVPGAKAPASVGQNGLTLRVGLLQLTAYVPRGTGTAKCLEAAAAVEAGFPVGSYITQGTTQVQVVSVSPGPYLDEPSWLYQPLTVEWRVFSQT